MRSSLLLALALAVASPLAANWLPVWTPADVHLVVGQTINVQVQVQFSGLLPNVNDPVNESFASDNDQVATAFVIVQDKQRHNVQITAMGPGTAAIRSVVPHGFGNWAWVHITVDCGVEQPIRPVSAVLNGSIGKPVTIAVVSNLEQTVFAWYLGRNGDRSHPLDTSGSVIAFTPNAYGSHYVWGTATSACSASAAACRVDGPLPRR